MAAERARAARILPRVLAQQRGGDGLHPHRGPARRAARAGGPGARGGGHLRRAGCPRDRLHDRRAGMGALAAGERARPDGGRRRVRRRVRAGHAARMAAAPAAGFRQPVRGALGAVRRRFAGRAWLGRHHRLAREHAGQGRGRLQPRGGTRRVLWLHQRRAPRIRPPLGPPCQRHDRPHLRRAARPPREVNRGIKRRAPRPVPPARSAAAVPGTGCHPATTPRSGRRGASSPRSATRCRARARCPRRPAWW